METECATQNDTLNGLLQKTTTRRTEHFNDDDNMSTTPNERVVETAAKSLDDDVVLEMIRACVQKNQCYSCGEDASVVDEKIVNDECAYTFASPFVLSRCEKEQQRRGIFVNMKTRRAVSRKYLRVDSRKTNRQGLYLERRFRKVFDDVVNEEEKEEEKKSCDPLQLREKKGPNSPFPFH